ncbi:unnamed protein product [Orchesella dallaii]|uniref:Uncharacterized protein n=1 Tax=Orchesella dallaii TaxID=48710 RepID=A0ABP1PQC2_9HEXA
MHFRGLKWLEGRKNSELYKQLYEFRMKSKSSLEKLEFRNVQFVFIIFTIGCSMACPAFCIEHCIAGRWKRVSKADKRIRKISRIVQRKISMTKVPSGSGGGEQNEAGPNVITVTFLP